MFWAFHSFASNWIFQHSHFTTSTTKQVFIKYFYFFLIFEWVQIFDIRQLFVTFSLVLSKGVCQMPVSAGGLKPSTLGWVFYQCATPTDLEIWSITYSKNFNCQSSKVQTLRVIVVQTSSCITLINFNILISNWAWQLEICSCHFLKKGPTNSPGYAFLLETATEAKEKLRAAF